MPEGEALSAEDVDSLAFSTTSIDPEMLDTSQQLKRLGRRVEYDFVPENNESFYESIAAPTNGEFESKEIRQLSYLKGKADADMFKRTVPVHRNYKDCLKKIRKVVLWKPDMEKLALSLVFHSTGLRVVLFRDFVRPLRCDGEENIGVEEILIARFLTHGKCIYYPTVALNLIDKTGKTTVRLNPSHLLRETAEEHAKRYLDTAQSRTKTNQGSAKMSAPGSSCSRAQKRRWDNSLLPIHPSSSQFADTNQSPGSSSMMSAMGEQSVENTSPAEPSPLELLLSAPLVVDNQMPMQLARQPADQIAGVPPPTSRLQVQTRLARWNEMRRRNLSRPPDASMLASSGSAQTETSASRRQASLAQQGLVPLQPLMSTQEQQQSQPSTSRSVNRSNSTSRRSTAGTSGAAGGRAGVTVYGTAEEQLARLGLVELPVPANNDSFFVSVFNAARQLNQINSLGSETASQLRQHVHDVIMGDDTGEYTLYLDDLSEYDAIWDLLPLSDSWSVRWEQLVLQVLLEINYNVVIISDNVPPTSVDESNDIDTDFHIVIVRRGEHYVSTRAAPRQ